MTLLYRLGAWVGLFVAGFLLHAWSPWAEGEPFVRPGSPLAVMDYESFGKVITDPEFEEEAARFLVELDSNYPGTATELLLAIVMLHERYGEPSSCWLSDIGLRRSLWRRAGPADVSSA